ncbi:MAG: hypothetical protein KGH76_04400 [Thaumarchaeota archaeon]|nr:hypothetical protein [Nitrososphaerota archaeon]
MVFGLGKKKTEQPAVPAQIEKTIKLDDIHMMLRQIEAPNIENAINVSKTSKDEIEIHRKKIRDIIIQLESDDLKLDEVDKNLATIVKRGKGSIVTTIKKETSSSLTNPVKYDQVVLLNTEIAQMLKKIGDVLGMNSRIIHIFAKKYADILKEEIAKIAKSRNQLQVSINSVENIKAHQENIANRVQKISEYKTTISQKTDRLSQINVETQSLKHSITNLQKQIQELKESTEYRRFLDVKKKIDSTLAEKSNIKNIISLQFSKISRPLGRYTYISSFEKSVKKMMDDLLVDPYEIVSSQNKNSIINILEAVEKSVISGSISVKDSEKSLEQIQETISKLDEFITLKESYIKKVSDLEKDLSIFNTKAFESDEQDLKKAEENLTSTENLKKKLEEEIKNSKQSLLENVQELEENLSKLTNSKISIEFS